jgi:hypothetical protein
MKVYVRRPTTVVQVHAKCHTHTQTSRRQLSISRSSFCTRSTLHHTLMSQCWHDVMAYVHHCQQPQETIGHTWTQLHHQPQNQCAFLDVNVRDNSFCDMDTAMHQPK